MDHPIRVLHIFAPNFRRRFGGPIFNWKFNFSAWDDSQICHLVLDNEKNLVIDANDALHFDYLNDQKISSKRERFFWIFSLFHNINSHKYDFDILHFHLLWWGGLIMAVWTNWNKIPAIYESVLLDGDTPGGILIQRFGKFKLWCLKHFKGILTITRSLEDDYLEHGFARQQVQTIMSCIDTELFHPIQSSDQKNYLRKKYDIPKEAFVLIFVGSLIKRKGIDILLKAFVEAAKSNPELYLLVVGPRNKKENPSIDENLIDDLNQIIRNCNVSSKVNFFGLIQDRGNLAELYQASDVFVFPSRQEGLGYVILEAMSTALPVIVSQLPVLEKIIIDGENGLYVPIEDIAKLKDLLIHVSTHSETIKGLGDNARKYAYENHSFDKWQSQMVQFYENLNE